MSTTPGMRAEGWGMIDEDENAAPLIRNPAAPGDLQIGDYVFASRWGDCDPGDPWHVGHVSEIGPHFVVVGEVSPRKWPRAMRITPEQGRRIVEAYPGMEKEWRRCNYVEIARVFSVDNQRPSES